MRTREKKPRDWAAFWLVFPMAAWTGLFVGGVLLYIVGLSFMTDGADGFGYLRKFTLDNYRMLLDAKYLKPLWLSLKLSFYTALVCLLVGYPFGYLMAKAKRRFKGLIMLLVIVPFWTNALVRVYGWKLLLLSDGPVNTALQAIGLISEPLKMLNTNGAVLLGMVYGMIPFMILPVYSSVEKMDWSLVDASRDMGASPMKAFLTVTLPLTAPGALAGCVLTFIPSIGLFFINDLLGSSKDLLVGNLVYQQMYKAMNLPFAAAISTALLALIGVILWLYRRAGGKSGDLAVF